MTIHDRFDWQNLTPEDGHFTFGYYDRSAWDPAGQKHLALRFPQQERLPTIGERADVGYVDKDERRFVKLAETEAWCHQLGSLMTWLPFRPGCFAFNDYRQDGDDWHPVTRIFHVDDGEQAHIDTHIYNLTPDGRWGSAINFARIPRPGYSFPRATFEPDILLPDLDDEGFSIVNMETGESKMIVTYRQMLDIHPLPYTFEGQYFWLNQGMFNCDGSRVMWLMRYADPTHPKYWPWQTDIYTSNLDGSELQCAIPNIYWRQGAISHEDWGRSPREIVVDADWLDNGTSIVVFDERISPIRGQKICDGLGAHSHVRFSPNGEWVAFDTYPDDKLKQHLAIANVATGEITRIGAFHHAEEVKQTDLRCDLHPRWSSDGRLLTVDTIHDGQRKIYMLDVSELVKNG